MYLGPPVRHKAHKTPKDLSRWLTKTMLYKQIITCVDWVGNQGSAIKGRFDIESKWISRNHALVKDVLNFMLFFPNHRHRLRQIAQIAWASHNQITWPKSSAATSCRIMLHTLQFIPKIHSNFRNPHRISQNTPTARVSSHNWGSLQRHFSAIAAENASS